MQSGYTLVDNIAVTEAVHSHCDTANLTGRLQGLEASQLFLTFHCCKPELGDHPINSECMHKSFPVEVYVWPFVGLHILFLHLVQSDMRHDLSLQHHHPTHAFTEHQHVIQDSNVPSLPPHSLCRYDRLLLDCSAVLLALEGLRFREVSKVLCGLVSPSVVPSKEIPGMRGGTDCSCNSRLGFFSLTCAHATSVSGKAAAKSPESPALKLVISCKAYIGLISRLTAMLQSTPQQTCEQVLQVYSLRHVHNRHFCS